MGSLERRGGGQESSWGGSALWSLENSRHCGAPRMTQLPAFSQSSLSADLGWSPHIPHQSSALAFPFKMVTSAQNRGSLRTLSLTTDDTFRVIGIRLGMVLSAVT